MNENNAKLTKRSHAYKGYASSYNGDILNSFNPELQLEDTESAIRNKLKDLLTELRGFKFMTTLVVEFKKIESDDATKYTTFYSNSEAKTIINVVTLMMYLNQSILRLYQPYKNILGKFLVGLLIQ